MPYVICKILKSIEKMRQPSLGAVCMREFRAAVRMRGHVYLLQLLAEHDAKTLKDVPPWAVMKAIKQFAADFPPQPEAR